MRPSSQPCVSAQECGSDEGPFVRASLRAEFDIGRRLLMRLFWYEVSRSPYPAKLRHPRP